jgi:hypothetical protein
VIAGLHALPGTIDDEGLIVVPAQHGEHSSERGSPFRRRHLRGTSVRVHDRISSSQ